MLKLCISLLFVCFSISAFAEDKSQELANMTFIDLYNQKVQLKDFNRPIRSGILVNIWATWCKPCVEELPSLLRLQSKTQDFTVIALSVDSDPKAIKNFYKRNRIPETMILNLVDKDAENLKKLGYTRVPTTLLINNKGKIVEVFVGSRKWDSSFMLVDLKASLEKSSKDLTNYYN